MKYLLPAAGTRDAVDLCVSNHSDRREPIRTPAAKFRMAWDSLFCSFIYCKTGRSHLCLGQLLHKQKK